ncbi:NAD(P)/FAD-dependent oxidoreductase [Puteibacter caeruleilacunae]|nr:NAD(P)/FAD-dependent oxidoreductase [Puteibacter caeruleilacunae]
MTNIKKKKVIIVGGGFAGIQLTRNLNDKLFDILLIDKVNHHQFQPLFYQVASSQLEPSSISFPLRHIFRKKKNVQIRLGKLLEVDKDNNEAHFDIGVFQYDYLVLAMGCTTNFFGNETIAKHAFTLKTTYDAITIRNHLLQTFENFLSAKDEDKEGLLNLVIVGAGPTGVEMAGALAEIKKHALPYDFHRIDFSRLRIILIEGSENTLNSMSTNAQISSKRYLKELGIEVQTETFVRDYDGEQLTLSDGNSIKTKTVIWAAGVIANVVNGLPAESITSGNRVIVNRVNKVDATDNIYALGDMAYMETPGYPHGHPQVANVAINQAKNLANNLENILENRPLKEYTYKDLGSMATLARNKAVVDLPFMKFKGFFAWVVWMFLHLMLILSVRNKLIIFINWAWAYITKNTALRLILKDSD